MGLRRVEDFVNRENHAIEFLTLDCQLFPAGSGQGVIPGASIVFRRPPRGLHPALEQQLLQVEGAREELRCVGCSHRLSMGGCPESGHAVKAGFRRSPLCLRARLPSEATETGVDARRQALFIGDPA